MTSVFPSNPIAGAEAMDSFPKSTCLMCGSEGLVRYEQLSDRAFHAPGKWTLKQCPNSACNLMWLDPMPSEKDIWKAYTTYYTHPDAPSDEREADFVRRIFRQTIEILKRSFLNRKYGYTGNSLTLQTNILGLLAYMMPWRKSDWDMSVMFLPWLKDGKLLEIGCGSGDLLNGMRKLGWDTQGVDVDSAALENARNKGLRVTLGLLEEMHFAKDSFDAICMAHVIEHVHDPLKLLTECRRILKPGGRLTLVTPNAQSFCHRLFGRAWFALEPPRHLHIFTISTMAQLLKEAGFDSREVFTTIRDTDGLFVASQSIRRTGRFTMRSRQPYVEKILGRFVQIAEWLLLKVSPTAGEELSAKAVK
jgi:2-polyprenyl-3-methyl-5-hydroxy-6-metoxy-1,4-benzoquinol methylase